jgi:RES domain-containing protein
VTLDVRKGFRIHDRDLLDKLEQHHPRPQLVQAWRTTWAHRDPLSGSTAAGRWNPEGHFEVLYTSLDFDGSIAEAYYHSSRAPILSTRPVKVHRLRVSTQRSLVLDSDNPLARLGVDMTRYKNPISDQSGLTRTQEIGAAAHFLEYDSLLVPSARWSCLNLVIFLDRIDSGAAIALETSEDVNWPAWREQRAGSARFE